MLLEIQETSGLFLMVLSMEKYFGESGRLKILDHCNHFSCTDRVGVVDVVVFFVLDYFNGYLSALLSEVSLGGRILGGTNLLLHRNDFCQQALLADVSCCNTYLLVTRFSFFGC